MHFQTWSDKAGNAPPLTAVDPVTGVSITFPDLNSAPFGGEEFQTKSDHARAVSVLTSRGARANLPLLLFGADHTAPGFAAP